jgi:hypothetical protein
MVEVLPKYEIHKRVNRLMADESSPWSWPMLGELCGYHWQHLRHVFIYKDTPMTDPLQIRMSKALGEIERGEVSIMRNKDNSRFVKYNKDPKLRVARGYQIELRGGQLAVKTGLVNRNDYSKVTLKEQLES